MGNHFRSVLASSQLLLLLIPVCCEEFRLAMEWWSLREFGNGRKVEGPDARWETLWERETSEFNGCSPRSGIAPNCGENGVFESQKPSTPLQIPTASPDKLPPTLLIGESGRAVRESGRARPSEPLSARRPDHKVPKSTCNSIAYYERASNLRNCLHRTRVN